MSWGSGAAELAMKIAEYHKELVTTSVQFEELRRQTAETLGDVRSVVRNLQEQAQVRELKHVQEVSELKAQIASLHARLDMLSERAMHAVLREVAKERLDAPAPDSSDNKLLQARGL